MSSRATVRLAWGLAVLAPALMIVSSILSAGGPGIDLEDSFIWAIALVFAGVGVLIATRQPENAIGWIFLASGVAAGLGALAHSIAQFWIDGRGGPESLAKAAALYGELSWIPFILMPATFLLLLFPDGHLLSRRWRAVAWCAAVGMAGGFVSSGLNPGPIPDFPKIRNPIAVDHPLVDLLEGISYFALMIGVVGSSISLIVRFRRSRGVERQQMKWLALAGAGVAMTIPIALITYDAIGENAANAWIMLSVLGLPAATGVAVLRYRLYDIDVVINRALVYGALTAILAGTYVGAVLLLQLVLRPITEESNLAIAASTLAVAAIFRPARTRIQAAVDRRFYRRRYDAARTLETFADHLRDEIALDSLSAELRGVVAETMQPAHVSLWLRVPEAR